MVREAGDLGPAVSGGMWDTCPGAVSGSSSSSGAATGLGLCGSKRAEMTTQRGHSRLHSTQSTADHITQVFLLLRGGEINRRNGCGGAGWDNDSTVLQGLILFPM